MQAAASALSLQEQRARNDYGRYIRYEQWRLEQLPVQLAEELLDPHGQLKAHAERLVAERIRQSRKNEFMGRSDPFTDLLGAARIALAAKELNPTGYEDALQNLRNDFRSLFTEALFKEGGHISTMYAEVNDHGEAVVAGEPHYNIFLRGVNHHLPDWVVEVRNVEITEEFLKAALFNDPALRQTHALVTLSPRPERSQEELKEAHYGDSDLCMVRLSYFEQQINGTWKTRTDQLYRNGSNVDDANAWLQTVGAADQNDPRLDATQVQGHFVLVRRDVLPDGVASIGQMFDVITSERLEQPIFNGKPSSEVSQLAQYSRLFEIAQKREQAFEHVVDSLCSQALELADSSLSHQEQNKAAAQLIITALRHICLQYPQYASSVFGKEAAEYYKQAHDAIEHGDHQAAERATEAAFERSTSANICDSDISVAAALGNNSEALSEAARKEAKHCLEIKEKGFTIRRGVHCPFCKQTVDAYDTATSITCMDKSCGITLIKETGKVIDPRQAMATEAETAQKEAEVIQFRPRLRHGMTYTVGNTKYQCHIELKIGGTELTFIDDAGTKVSGKAAESLAETIKAALQPVLQEA